MSVENWAVWVVVIGFAHCHTYLTYIHTHACTSICVCVTFRYLKVRQARTLLAIIARDFWISAWLTASNWICACANAQKFFLTYKKVSTYVDKCLHLCFFSEFNTFQFHFGRKPFCVGVRHFCNKLSFLPRSPSLMLPPFPYRVRNGFKFHIQV